MTFSPRRPWPGQQRYVSARVEANDASSNVMPTQVGIHASDLALETETCVDPRLRGDDVALVVLVAHSERSRVEHREGNVR